MAYIDVRGGKAWARLIVNGHEAPINILREAQPDILSYSKRQVKDCAKGYMLIGPIEGGVTTGIDRAEQLGFVPSDYKGSVFTNKIEVIGPEMMLR